MMRLVIVYGPPGVGKLTIAREIADQTDFLVFHNHMVINLVEPYVTRRHPDFTPLVYDLQRQILTAAMEAKHTDIVFTFAFSRDEQEAIQLLDALRDAGTRLGVEVHFVYVRCARRQHLSRLTDPRRRELAKLTDVETLTSMAQAYDLEHPYSGAEGLNVDTTDMTSRQAAEYIIARLFRPQ